MLGKISSGIFDCLFKTLLKVVIESVDEGKPLALDSGTSLDE